MGTSTRCGASSLPKAFLTSLLEKANCARRFEEKPPSQEATWQVGQLQHLTTSAHGRMVTRTRCGASGLPKALLMSLLEKANCAFLVPYIKAAFMGGVYIPMSRERGHFPSQNKTKGAFDAR